MADLIDRQMTIEEIDKMPTVVDADGVRYIKKSDIKLRIAIFPPVIQKQKTGKWIKVGGYCTPGGDPVWMCSECGKGVHTYGIEAQSYQGEVSDKQWVACPNCGAKMEA